MNLKMTALASTIVVLTLFSTPDAAVAGNKTMTNAKTGETVSIHCRGSGCNIQIMNKSGAVTGNRSSAGGTANFNKQVAKYKSEGFR